MTIPSDPNILFSFLNMKLRDRYDSLDELCDDLDLDRDEIEKVLLSIGYAYDGEKNAFVGFPAV
ncbi:MAG: DUF4250 domain-containing protein [Christensenellaceae bacterium]